MTEIAGRAGRRAAEQTAAARCWPGMPAKRQAYSADKARGGEVVLRTPWRRLVFIAGLAGAIVLGLVLASWGLWH